MRYGVNKVLLLIVIHLFYSITLRASNISISSAALLFDFRVKKRSVFPQEKYATMKIFPHTHRQRDKRGEWRRKSIVMIMMIGKVGFSAFRHQETLTYECASYFFHLPLLSFFHNFDFARKWLQLILLELFQFRNLLRITICCFR